MNERSVIILAPEKNNEIFSHDFQSPNMAAFLFAKNFVFLFLKCN